MYTNDKSLVVFSKCIELSATFTSAKGWKEKLLIQHLKYVTFTLLDGPLFFETALSAFL